MALALGTIRLAKRNVLLNDMKSIEALARVDVLCVDKTGTITEPKMEVRNVVPLDKDETASIEDMLFCYVSASHDQNATMSALRDMFCRNGFLNEPFVPSGVVPFSSSLKYGVMNFENGTWILGAPEFVLKDKIDAVKDEMAEYAKKDIGFWSLQGRRSRWIHKMQPFRQMSSLRPLSCCRIPSAKTPRRPLSILKNRTLQ